MIDCIFGSSNRGASAGTHIHGTHVPVEEPSTSIDNETQDCGDTVSGSAVSGI